MRLFPMTLLLRLVFVIALGIALGWWMSEPSTEAGGGTYTVRPEDTLSQIAAAHGTSIDVLISLNQGQYPRIQSSRGRYIAAGWELAIGRQENMPRWQALLKQAQARIKPMVAAAQSELAPQATSDSPRPAAVGAVPGSTSASVEQVEASLVEQTNAARINAALPALQVDATLTALARQRSQDMIDRDYFSHKDPDTGGSLLWPYCIEPLNVEFCGENLAGANGLADARENVVGRWMASEGHRANILRPEFGRIGIGIATGGQWGAVVTQLLAP